MLAAQGFYAVIGRSRHARAGARRGQGARCRRRSAPAWTASGDGDAATASNNPPLYYLAQDVAYARRARRRRHGPARDRCAWSPR